jgi:hypothetical protein
VRTLDMMFTVGGLTANDMILKNGRTESDRIRRKEKLVLSIFLFLSLGLGMGNLFGDTLYLQRETKELGGKKMTES